MSLEWHFYWRSNVGTRNQLPILICVNLKGSIATCLTMHFFVCFTVDAADKSIWNCKKARRRLVGNSKNVLLPMIVFELHAATPHGFPKAQKVFKDFPAGKTIRNIELQAKKREGDFSV